MSRNILVINGHPDPRPERFCAALCDAYSEGAQARGCATRRLNVGALKMPRAANDDLEAWNGIEAAYRLVRAADEITIIYPLWANAPPAALKQLLDYVARLRRHLDTAQPGDKAARLVVTTELPAFLYRAKPACEATALAGVQAKAQTFIGSVDTMSKEQRQKWLKEMRQAGACAA
ncbi:MAG: NAD(P)H-dependent oxidoreductase [Alphaproteobacteria bacterium]|nr:NAD(P)H-dependent oxidoreductase [Alphaproteobacteria bacterium]MBL6936603.1 NAD(P)H-dependent oxidoreductase [Alphaproteobacteria bacterium]MBL7098346.1 NAD(P)H-dependent oxidoreductase [Alphaproteobacteria bacterium]